MQNYNCTNYINEDLDMFSTFTTAPTNVGFEYYVVPEDGSTNHILAITATPRTVTTYTTFLSNSVAHHVCDFAIGQYKFQNKDAETVHRNALDHDSLHSSDKDEIDVRHYHLRHAQPLRLANLRNLLKEAIRSEKGSHDSRVLPKWEKMITKKISKDILSKFTDFKQKLRAGKLSGTYKTSNSKFYLKHMSDLSIAKHNKCLIASGGTLGCLPGNPKTPAEILEKESRPFPKIPHIYVGNTPSPLPSRATVAIAPPEEAVSFGTTEAVATALVTYTLFKYLRSPQQSESKPSFIDRPKKSTL